MKTVIVGIDIRDLQIAKTGARTYLEELIAAFEKNPDQRFKYVRLGSDCKVYHGKSKLLKLVEHIRFFFWKQVQLPLAAKAKGCEILICTDYFVPFFSLGIKNISVFHDAFFYEYPEHYNRYWLSIFKTVGISAAKKAAFIVTPTAYAQKQIAKLSSLPIEKIFVIPEAAKTFSLSKHEPNLDLAFRLSEMSYFLHVGTMEKRKNLSLLLYAFKKLKEGKHPDLKLLLIGQFSPKSDMDDQNEILKTINELQLNDQVIFPGYVSNEDLVLYYQNAKAYIFPSLNEGFGLPILEAFSFNIPVIAANNTCMPEVGGNAALYFNPYDVDELSKKMELLLHDQELKELLINRGKERLELFSWDLTVNQFIRLFEQIIPD